MDLVTGLGLIAATCTTIAFLPQVIRNWRTRSTGNLSFGTFTLFTVGVAFWLVYGLMLRSVPIIAANVITLALQIANLGQMIWYRRQSGRLKPPDTA
jgi:MtN3 and saliva related transmembrane protein